MLRGFDALALGARDDDVIPIVLLEDVDLRSQKLLPTPSASLKAVDVDAAAEALARVEWAAMKGDGVSCAHVRAPGAVGAGLGDAALASAALGERARRLALSVAGIRARMTGAIGSAAGPAAPVAPPGVQVWWRGDAKRARA